MINDDKNGSTKFEGVGKVRCPRRVIPILQAFCVLARSSGTQTSRLGQPWRNLDAFRPHSWLDLRHLGRELTILEIKPCIMWIKNE